MRRVSSAEIERTETCITIDDYFHLRADRRVVEERCRRAPTLPRRLRSFLLPGDTISSVAFSSFKARHDDLWRLRGRARARLHHLIPPADA